MIFLRNGLTESMESSVTDEGGARMSDDIGVISISDGGLGEYTATCELAAVSADCGVGDCIFGCVYVRFLLKLSHILF